MLWTSEANTLYLIQQIITSKKAEKSGWWINHEQNGGEESTLGESGEVPLTKEVKTDTKRRGVDARIWHQHSDNVYLIHSRYFYPDLSRSLSLAYFVLAAKGISTALVPWGEIKLLGQHFQSTFSAASFSIDQSSYMMVGPFNDHWSSVICLRCPGVRSKWVNEYTAENCRDNLPSFTFIQTTWVRISPFIFTDALNASI